MSKLYLIQRGTFKNVSEDIYLLELGRLVQWSYMGSAEFEFGAMANAYTRILKDYDEYELFDTSMVSNITKEKLIIFCRKDRYDKVIKELELFINSSNQEYHLKEFSGIRDHFSETLSNWNSSKIYNFWWSYDRNFDEKDPGSLGDFIMFLDKDNYKNMVSKCLNNLKSYWDDLSDEDKNKRISKCTSW